MYGIIYLVTNIVDNKVYVGQTTASKDRRWIQHISDANCKRGSVFSRALRKHGPNKFNIEAIQTCESKEELDFAEIFYIEFLKSMAPNGYNLTDGGHARENYVTSDETREKMRKKKLGRKLPDSTKEKMSLVQSGVNNGFYGKKHDEETKLRMRKPKNAFKDLSGITFGRLTVLGVFGRTEDKCVLWECKCICEKVTKVRSHSLTSGHTKSCGCLNKDIITGRIKNL